MSAGGLQSSQPPSQSDTNYEIRPGYSRLYQALEISKYEMAKMPTVGEDQI